MGIRKIFCKSLGFQLLLLSLMCVLGYNVIVSAEDTEEWMPDPALRKVVSEQLGVENFTQDDMLHLHNLIAIRRNIVELKGLEHAKNLGFLDLGGNQISDLRPLAGLTHLEVLRLGGNQIEDISPLSELINLKELHLNGNQIEDISPLSELINLEELNIIWNRITDLSPLNGLMRLENLQTRHNLLSCEISRDSVEDRIRDREYPSLFSAWHNIINRPNEDEDDLYAYHDLFFGSQKFGTRWHSTHEGIRVIGNLELAQHKRQKMLSKNPNMLFLVAIKYNGADRDAYPEDWPYWLRDESGNRIGGLIDFTLPGAQDIAVEHAIAVAKCGLYDGIFLDWWNENRIMGRISGRISPNNEGVYTRYYRGTENELEARLTILLRIREAVEDDFLIIVNSNRSTLPHSAPYVNGTFMETIGYLEGYTHQALIEIESTLLWAEQNLRAPQINCLEGWGIPTEPLDTPKNKQQMRVFTTMSLTHSDGYIMYVTGIGFGSRHTHAYEIWEGHSEMHARGEEHDHFHQHYWYEFWEANLGRPVGGNETKGQTYNGIEGLFIREFTNGWAVYNRSGKEQTVSLLMETTGVASGIKSRTHTVPDLDGEIYLKQETGISTDVNGDGVVNIQDLVIIVNALGEAEPDLNGDGVVNIQDLVLVANAF